VQGSLPVTFVQLVIAIQVRARGPYKQFMNHDVWLCGCSFCKQLEPLHAAFIC
jgi:hypothetical protein